MPTYHYVAYSGEQLTQGSVSGANAQEVFQALSGKGLMVLSVVEQGPESWLSRLGLGFLAPSTTPTDQSLGSFARRLAMLLHGGLPLLRALTGVAVGQKPPLSDAIEGLCKQIASAGKDLSAAMALQPRVFPPLLRGLVAAGESSGNITAALKQYSEYVERQVDLKRKVGGAMTYPIIVLIAAAALMIFMSVRIVPTFAGIFATLHLRLPFMTRLIIHVSNFLMARWPELIFGSMALIILVRGYLETESGLRTLRRVQHGLPVIGRLFDEVWSERFLSTLAMTLKGGVSLLQALSVVEDVFADHPPLRAAIGDVRGRVVRGESIASSLKPAGILSPDDVASISAAEEAGRLTDSMQMLAEAHRDEVDYQVRRLTTLIEPALILVVGAVAGVMMLALFLPMAEMVNVRPN